MPPTSTIASVVAAVLLGAASVAAQPLNVLSFNLRLDLPSDAPNDWPARRDKVASQIRFHEADLIGVQEALHRQVVDLTVRLPGHRFVGVGRDDGRTAGEYSCIFYDERRFAVEDSGTFWLSRTPEVPGSKDWDAAVTRIVTWARFHDRQTGRRLVMFNTHFDHRGAQARLESARLLLASITRIAGEVPVVVTGDFNTPPGSDPIRLLTDSATPERLTDARGVSETGHYGPSGTFNGFKAAETSDEPIDFIFVRGPWRVLQHATLSQTWAGRFSSDHFPVFARLLLP
jgi:endonuclease/exonuclease/phosphatase family metal-dependent hydrolase